MFRRLDKLDGPIFKKWGHAYRGFIFGMLPGLHTWGVYIWEGLYTRGRGRINRILRYVEKCLLKLNLLIFYLSYYISFC